MKKLLTASILLNVALTVCLVALLKQQNPDFGPPASDFGNTNEPGPANTEISLSTSKEVESEQSAPAQSSRPAEMASSSGHLRPEEQPVLMPLVFQKVDLAQLNLNPDQLQAIEDLRQKFLDEIGGLQQDPTDPAYGEKWVRSQPQIDNDLRGMLGFATFQDFQIKAADLAPESKKTGSSVQ